MASKAVASPQVQHPYRAHPGMSHLPRTFYPHRTTQAVPELGVWLVQGRQDHWGPGETSASASVGRGPRVQSQAGAVETRDAEPTQDAGLGPLGRGDLAPIPGDSTDGGLCRHT